jgi:hypothetical protein
MTDPALSGFLLPPLAQPVDVQALAEPHLKAAFKRVGRILRSRTAKSIDIIRAARFIAEYAVGRPTQVVRIETDPELELDRLDSVLLARIAAGQVNGAALLKLMPPAPPVVDEPDEIGEV